MAKSGFGSRPRSLNQKLTLWFAGAAAVLMLAAGIFYAASRAILSEFDGMLRASTACYEVQAALDAEAKCFEAYVREPSQPNRESYQQACEEAARCVMGLPFDYTVLGEERYARTWNLRQGYQGYRKYRDAFFARDAEEEQDVELFYRVLEMQDALADYALRLSEATLEQSSQSYQRRMQLLQRLPAGFAALLLGCLGAVAGIRRRLAQTVVTPMVRMAEQSRRIAEKDFSVPDLPVCSEDEAGELTAAFNRMKHAVWELLAAREQLHQKEVANLRLEKSLEHTRLEMLKSQVDPHFLFNTLNMISCMARLEEADTTGRMILSLSSLFRYNLRTKAQEVPLEQELDAVEDYVYLQLMRYDDRVCFCKQIRADAEKVMIPSFTLQPLVENAFSHGLAGKESGGRITLRVWETEGCAVVSVADNGKGMTVQERQELEQKLCRSEQTGRGIGLGNLSRRVGMLYPDGALRIYSQPGRGTVVQLRIPQKKEEREDV
ncbi:MAG: sensor histidine kinase [Faecalibacterium sp.]